MRQFAYSELERLALATASAEGEVNHARLREISTEHPADITKKLAYLVKEGFLVADGIGRGMVYFLPWINRKIAHEFGRQLVGRASLLTPELEGLTPELDLPLFAEIKDLPDAVRVEMMKIARPVRDKERANPDVLKDVVVALCSARYLGIRVLSDVLKRDPDDLRKRTLNPLVNEQKLRRAFRRPSDPRQAYTSSQSGLGAEH